MEIDQSEFTPEQLAVQWQKCEQYLIDKNYFLKHITYGQSRLQELQELKTKNGLSYNLLSRLQETIIAGHTLSIKKKHPDIYENEIRQVIFEQLQDKYGIQITEKERYRPLDCPHCASSLETTDYSKDDPDGEEYLSCLDCGYGEAWRGVRWEEMDR